MALEIVDPEGSPWIVTGCGMARDRLLAPLLIPFGAGVQAYRALARSTLSARRRKA